MKTDPLAVFCGSPDGGGDIFSPEHSRPIRLNRTAAVIWNCLSRGDSSDSAVKEVLAVFPGASENTVKKDVAIFIQLLKKQRLLQEKDVRGYSSAHNEKSDWE